MYLTVGLSVLAHGLSAAPLVNRYVAWFERTSTSGAPAMESTPVHEHRLALTTGTRRRRTLVAVLGQPGPRPGRAGGQALKFGLKMNPTMPPSGFVTSAVTMPPPTSWGAECSVAPAATASSTVTATSLTPQ